MSNMQGGGKKNRSAMDNIVVISAITGKHRQGDKNTDLLLADAEKCFNKLRQKDFLTEIEDERYNKNNIKMIFEMNKKSEILKQEYIYY